MLHLDSHVWGKAKEMREDWQKAMDSNSNCIYVTYGGETLNKKLLNFPRMQA